MGGRHSQRPGALTHTRITWALSPMVPQVLGVTMKSPLCPWYCRHSSRRGARHTPCSLQQWEEQIYTTMESKRTRTNVLKRSTIMFQYNLCFACILKYQEEDTIIVAAKGRGKPQTSRRTKTLRKGMLHGHYETLCTGTPKAPNTIQTRKTRR